VNDAAARSRIILIAYEVSPTGGMSRAAHALVSLLLERGAQVTVVARICEVPSAPNLRWIRVPLPKRPASIATPLFFLLGPIAVWRAGSGLRISEGPTVGSRVDILRLHFLHRGYSERPTSRQRTRDTIAYRTNALLASVLGRLWERWCLRPRRVRAVVAVSSGLAEELERYFPALEERVEVIPNSVDLETFRPDQKMRTEVRKRLGIAESVPVAVFVGGTWERKGLRFAIDSVAALPDWQLIVVGQGDREAYALIADQAGAGGRVHFTGMVRQTAPYYAAADAFVFPTHYEALSLVTLEAAAAGLPLLVTRVSGADEIVREDENGWFIERDPQTITPRLKALSEDPELGRRLGDAARAAVAPFSPERVAQRYKGLLADLSRSSQSPG
jgi:glycosyltransferase involved in cell wall biosynthesis